MIVGGELRSLRFRLDRRQQALPAGKALFGDATQAVLLNFNGSVKTRISEA